MERSMLPFAGNKQRIFLDNERKGSPISRQKYFPPVCFLLHLTGINISPGFSVRNNLCKCIPKYTKFIFNFLLLLTLYSQFNWLVVLKEKRTEAALFLILLIQITAHISVYRNQQQIELGLKALYKMSDILPDPRSFRKLKILVWMYTIFFISTLTALIPSNFSTSGKEALKQCSKSSFLLDMFDDPSKYCLIIQNASKVLIPSVLESMLGAFTVFYSFTCVYIYLLLKKLAAQMRNLKSFRECYRMLYAYQEMASAITLLDDHMSYSAFVTFLSSMAGIFRVIFAEESFSMTVIYSRISGIMYLAVFLSIALPASAVTQEGRTVWDLILSLPGKFQSHYKELNVILKCNCKREVVLTLWKIYVIKKSIVISACGTLLTYGILFATLGTVQVPKSDLTNKTGPFAFHSV
ncbi:uncharacterized protein TNCV_1533011 [Trichonephila clavipes]|nr:uncharacterized protein TNCV_1533011 [Trichonephila clavipes]